MSKPAQSPSTVAAIAEATARMAAKPPRPPGAPRVHKPRVKVTTGRAIATRRVVWSAEAALTVATRRAALGITQRELEVLTGGIPQSYIARIEAAERAPGPDQLDRICKALGLAWYQPAAIVVPNSVARTLLASTVVADIHAGPKTPNHYISALDHSADGMAADSTSLELVGVQGVSEGDNHQVSVP